MRIQPHVWAASSDAPDAFLPGVLRDAVTTHGHPRAVLGAALHAITLAFVLHRHLPPEPRTWRDLAASLEAVAPLMARDEALADRWLPLWERHVGSPWPAAVEAGAKEIAAMLDVAADASRGRLPLEERYEDLASRLGGLDARSRGAGHTSAILALWLTWEARDAPYRGVRAAATLRGSDTDTVASMAGALLGTLSDETPPGKIQDHELLEREAIRLSRISQGEPVDDFPHPDPLRWEPPSTQSDAVGIADEMLAVAGLGFATPMSDLIAGHEDGVGWQWLRLDNGQTILAKRRLEPPALPLHSLPRARRNRERQEATRPQSVRAVEAPSLTPRQTLPIHIDDAVDQVVTRNFDQVLIGRLTVHFARMAHGAENAAIFAALVAERLRQSERG